MEAIDYLKMIRSTLMSKTSIDPDQIMTDYEVILNYFVAGDDGVSIEFEDIDLPVAVALEKAMPVISPEDQRSIAFEKYILPAGKTDLEEGALIFGKSRTREQQYRFLAELYIDSAFWQIVKADSKSISREDALKVREELRESLENVAMWKEREQKMIVFKEHQRRIKEKNNEYPGNKEELIGALKKYIGYTEISGEPFDIEAAWVIAGRKLEEEENVDWEKELDDLPEIPGYIPDKEALWQRLLQRMKETEEKKAKANSGNAKEEAP